jgi:hypothetical protein
MKKLIAISVVFALVAGVAFAVDLGGSVQGTVTVLKGSTEEDSKITSDGTLNQLRLEGAGEAGDGAFGGWLRFEPASLGGGGFSFNEDGEFSGDGYSLSDGVNGLVWWKPIDQFKLIIGVNPDGHWGKEGVTGWMFYQTASDVGVTFQGDNVWDGTGLYNQGLKFRNAFFRGVGDRGALLEIKPIDMLGINIAIPFIAKAGAETGDIFKATVAQIDVNLDFGNIALTYEGEESYIQNGNKDWRGGGGGTIFVYFGGSFGELSLDVGLGYQLTGEDEKANPIAAGLGLKYAADAFGVKFRVVGSFGGEESDKTKVLTDVMPYFGLGDNLTAFVSIGLGMKMGDDETTIGWHFNPFLQVGEEWGPKFLFGVKVMSYGGEDAPIYWAVPIGMMVSF